MVDLTQFREYCEFGEDRVYILLAIARSKENEAVSGSDRRTLRRVVSSESELAEMAAELDHAVGRFDARYRLYLTANARDALAAVFALRQATDDWIEMRLHGNKEVNAKFKRVDGEFTSILQSDRCAAETNFVFDLDDATDTECATLENRLAEFTTVSLVRETPNGYHVVTDPFDYTEFETDVEYELKTDGLVFVSYLGE